MGVRKAPFPPPLHISIVRPTGRTSARLRTTGRSNQSDDRSANCSRTADICQSNQCSPELTMGQWVMGQMGQQMVHSQLSESPLVQGSSPNPNPNNWNLRQVNPRTTGRTPNKSGWVKGQYPWPIDPRLFYCDSLEQKYRYRIDFNLSLKWLQQVVWQATCRSCLSKGYRATTGLSTDVGWP